MTIVFDTILFNSEATITATTWSTSSSDGSISRADGTAQTNVPCRINAMNASESIRIGREFGQTTFEGFFPTQLGDGTSVVLTTDSKVVVGSVTYRVLGPPVDQGGVGGLYAVTLEVDQ